MSVCKTVIQYREERCLLGAGDFSAKTTWTLCRTLGQSWGWAFSQLGRSLASLWYWHYKEALPNEEYDTEYCIGSTSTCVNEG